MSYGNGWDGLLSGQGAPSTASPELDTPALPGPDHPSVYGNGWDSALNAYRTQGPEVSRSLWDVTGGAALYGGAHAVDALSKFVNREFTSSEANSISDQMETFMSDHPEYSPAKINGMMDLLTNPGALSSRIFSGVPLMAATMGLAAAAPFTGGATGVLAFGLNYGIGAQDAYERAKADGATEDQASRSSTIQGLVYGALSTYKAAQVLHWLGGSFQSIAVPAVKEATEAINALDLPASAFRALTMSPVVKSAALAATINVIQGYSDQLIPKGVFGRPFDADWAQQLGEAAIVGGVTGAGFGVLSGHGEPVRTDNNATNELDVYSRDSLHQQLTTQHGLSDTDAWEHVKVTDAHAKAWAEMNNRDPAEWYASRLTTGEGHLDPDSHTLVQDTKDVGGYYSQLHDAIHDLPQEKWDSPALEKHLLTNGVSQSALDWSGVQNELDTSDKVSQQSLLETIRDNQAKLVESINGPQAAEQWLEDHKQFNASRDEAWLQQQNAAAAFQKISGKPITTPEEGQAYQQAQETAQETAKNFDQADGALKAHVADVSNDTAVLPGPNEGVRQLSLKPPSEETAAEEPTPLSELISRRRTPNADKLSLIENIGGPEASHDMAIRRALQDAVDNGQDHLGLVTGDQRVGQLEGVDPGDIPAIKKQYDETLRQQLLGEARKLDPSASLEWHDIGDGQKVPAVRLTDQIKDRVVDGLPLFQREATWRDLQKASRVAVAVLKDGRVMAMEGDHADYLKQKSFAPEDVAHFVTGLVDRKGTLLTSADEPSGSARSIHGIDTAANEPYKAVDYPLGKYQVVTNDSSFYKQEFFQTNKGSTTFYRDGRALIRGFQAADESTGLHELFHVFRRDLAGPDHDIASKWSGAKKQADGSYIWDRAAEEKFARGGERYLAEGRAPTPELQSVFAKFKQWLSKIYAAVAGSPLKQQLMSDTMRGVMDRLFATDVPEITRAREALAQASADLKSGKQKAASNPDLFDPNQVTGLREKETTARNELVRVQQSQLMPESPTVARDRRTDTLQRALAADTSERTASRWSYTKVLDPFRRVVLEGTAGMERLPAGKEYLGRQSDSEVYWKKVVGEHQIDIAEGQKILTKQDQTWLNAVDEKGFSNARKFVDRAGVPDPQVVAPSPTLQRFYDIARKLFDRGSKELEDNGVLRNVQGTLVPAEGQDTIRSPRVLTSAGYDAIARGAGPMYDSIIAGVKGANLGMENLEIHQKLQDMHGPGTTKIVGAAEQSRSIKYMPDTVKVNGKWVDLMQKDPIDLLTNMIKPVARRVGQIREFGQGLAETGPLRSVAKALGVYEKMSRETLANALIEGGVDRSKVYRDVGARADVINMDSTNVPQTFVELRKLAAQAGVKTQPSRTDLVDAINKLTAADFNKKTEVTLRNQAKQLQGIDFKAPIEQVLSELKRRIVEPSNDVLSELRDAFTKQGGSDQQFVATVRRAQGLSVGWQPEGGLWRGFKSMQNVLGSLQTALAVAPTIPQTLLQVPQMAGIGNYFKAMRDVMTDPKLTHAQNVAIGAIPAELFRQSTERGFALESFGRNVRKLFSGPMEWISDINNNIAAQAFRRLADQWKLDGGIDRGDELMAKRTLKLSEDEIGDIRKGQMSDLTYAKIVQNGVSGTQYHNEPMYRRGLIETNPLMRSLFSYSNYTAGTLRSTVEFGSNLIDVIKNGTVKDKAVMGGRLVTYLTAAMGAGFASEMLRQVFKGNLAQQQLQKDWEHRVLGALAEVGLMGPAQRMIEPLSPQDGDGFDKVFIGMMPQVEAITGVLTQLIGKGKFGKFGPIEGLARETEGSVPIVKAIHNWYDTFAYPDAHMYSDASIEGRRFERDVLKKKPTPEDETPMNPDQYKVFEHVKRYDLQGTIDTAKDYYRSELAKIMSDPVKATLQGKSPSALSQELRQSLMSKAPLGLNPLETSMMLRGLPMDQRREVMSAQLRYQAMVNAVAPG